MMNQVIFNIKNNLFRKNAVLQYKEAMQNCTLSEEQLLKLNWEKRKQIVTYAYNNTSFYKQFYDNVKFHPTMLQSESDWIKIPVLDKEMVRKHREEMKDLHLSQKFFGASTTGGSTGTPLKVYNDKRFHQEILGWRAFKWWNLSPAANTGILHRRVPTTFLKKLSNRTLWFPTKRIYLSASSINESDVKKFTESIEKNKIEWLQGYVGALERVADYILEKNINITTLKLVWSTSAPLFKNVRNKMEKAFNCKIMNQYGSIESPNIAIQCPHSDDLHINYDFVHVETNSENDILITNLFNYAFPLIKYRLGDRGTISHNKCVCGCPLPLLQEIKGRISDAIYTLDGLFIDGNYLTTIFDNYSEIINKFQIYQKNDYSVVVKVKLYEQNEKSLKIIAVVKDILIKNVNNKIPIVLEIVDNIEDDRGKIRYIVSEIALSKIK